MMTSTGWTGATSNVRWACVVSFLLLGLAGLVASASGEKGEQLAPSPVANCAPEPDLSAPLTEIVSDGQGRVRGTIVLANGRQAFVTVLSVLAHQKKRTDPVEDRKLRPIGQLLPPLQRVLRHPGVDLSAAVAQADHPGLAAGTGPVVRRPVGVQ